MQKFRMREGGIASHRAWSKSSVSAAFVENIRGLVLILVMEWRGGKVTVLFDTGSNGESNGEEGREWKWKLCSIRGRAALAMLLLPLKRNALRTRAIG